MADIIKSGIKFRVFAGSDSSSGAANWNILSFWGQAEDIELSNGNTVEYVLSRMDGITSDPASTSDHTTASALLVNSLASELYTITVDRNGWSTTRTTVPELGNESYYTFTYPGTVSRVLLDHPSIYLLPVSGTEPTREEYRTFMDLEMIADKTNKTLTFYTKLNLNYPDNTTPQRATIKIGIRGVILG